MKGLAYAYAAADALLLPHKSGAHTSAGTILRSLTPVLEMIFVNSANDTVRVGWTSVRVTGTAVALPAKQTPVNAKVGMAENQRLGLSATKLAKSESVLQSRIAAAGTLTDKCGSITAINLIPARASHFDWCVRTSATLIVLG